MSCKNLYLVQIYKLINGIIKSTLKKANNTIQKNNLKKYSKNKNT
jgi:hypothetical protein